MKKYLFTMIMFLLTMCVSGVYAHNGGHYYGNNVHYGVETSKSSIMPFGGGIGGGRVKTFGKEWGNSLNAELIAFNIYVSLNFTEVDSKWRNVSDFCLSQYGVVIPLIRFLDYDDRMAKCVALVPIYEDCRYKSSVLCNNANENIYNEKDIVFHRSGFGAGIMYKSNHFYVMGKFTRLSAGVSIGLCL